MHTDYETITATAREIARDEFRSKELLALQKDLYRTNQRLSENKEAAEKNEKFLEEAKRDVHIAEYKLNNCPEDNPERPRLEEALESAQKAFEVNEKTYNSKKSALDEDKQAWTEQVTKLNELIEQVLSGEKKFSYDRIVERAEQLIAPIFQAVARDILEEKATESTQGTDEATQ